MLSDKYTSQWHINSFRGIIDQLSEYTTSCVFSFVDVYDKVKNNLKNEKVIPFTKASMDELARGFSQIASHHSIILKTCAEELDLSKFGIEHSRCIDPNLISQLAKCDISIKKIKINVMNVVVQKVLILANITHVCTAVSIAMLITARQVCESVMKHISIRHLY